MDRLDREDFVFSNIFIKKEKKKKNPGEGAEMTSQMYVTEKIS